MLQVLQPTELFLLEYFPSSQFSHSDDLKLDVVPAGQPSHRYVIAFENMPWVHGVQVDAIAIDVVPFSHRAHSEFAPRVLKNPGWHMLHSEDPLLIENFPFTQGMHSKAPR